MVIREKHLLSAYLTYQTQLSKIVPGKEIWSDPIFSCPRCEKVQPEPKHGGERVTCHCGLHMEVSGNQLTLTLDNDD